MRDRVTLVRDRVTLVRDRVTLVRDRVALVSDGVGFRRRWVAWPPEAAWTGRDNAQVRLNARVDYALRAVVELAAAGATAERPVTAERLASAQDIPLKFLESILLQLRRGGIVVSQRGPEGGYWLARPADQISLAEVIRIIDGPLANIRGQRPEHLGYQGAAAALQDVWIALRASEREILDLVTIANVARSQLPVRVRKLAADPDAWV